MTASAHQRYLSEPRLAGLDGLRALSILAVIWHHTAPTWVDPLWVSLGAHGVSLFFAISGLLITSLLLRERDRRGRIDLKAFYLRRSLRIFPLYYTVLALYALAVALLEPSSAAGQAFWRHLPWFATYTSNLFVPMDGRVIFYFAWSLAAEEQFYLAWPPLLRWLGRPARAQAVLSALLLACVLLGLIGSRALSAVPIAILAGALLALLLHQARSFAPLQRWLGRPLSVPVVAALLLATLVGLPWAGALSQVLFGVLVASVVLSAPHRSVRWLTWRPLAWVGSVSYAMYLLHMLCKSGIQKLLLASGRAEDSLALFVLTCLAAMLAAALSWRYFEAPILRLKQRWER